jgi:hypothetical protein
MSASSDVNRGKSAPNPNRHAGKCTVCNSEFRLDVERVYHNFRPVSEIASEFDLSEDAIYRHVSFLGLDLKRSENTERVLLDVIARGFKGNKDIAPNIALGAVQELHKITGKHKLPETNPADLARDDKAKVEQFMAFMSRLCPDCAGKDETCLNNHHMTFENAQIEIERGLASDSVH